MADLTIRPETQNDARRIREIHDEAFGRDAEGRLVDRLRDEGLITEALIALSDRVVGHVVFSKLQLKGTRSTISAVALAPVAVVPAHQRRGVGSALIREGLRRCAIRGYAAALVLGDPAYYTRFAFSAEPAKRITSVYSPAGIHWMALALHPGALDDVIATVNYPSAFRIVD